MKYFKQHKPVLDRAVKAIHDRTFFAQYPEFPGAYDENADAEGRKSFQALVGHRYEELRQDSPQAWKGTEESPYLKDKLNIQYPAFEVNTLIKKGETAFNDWRKLAAEERAGILIEALENIKDRFFEIAYATMHTTGQGYMMAFQASGPHAADRALEAVATGYDELKKYPEKVQWDKPMGKHTIQLEKEWRAVPKGIGLVIGCSTFPTWNAVPGIFANLITGNAVIAKPHPGAILPIAIYIAEVQKVISEAGHDPHICQLAVDTHDHQITRLLAEHNAVKLIDYTGGSEFGNYLESLPGKILFTEKTGVNSVILNSVTNLDQALQNLAFSVSLYSGQMCTAPQNFFIPESGVETSEGNVPYQEVIEKFSQSVKMLVENPKAGPHVLGAIQNKKTAERIGEARKMGKVVLDSMPIENPMFKNARTASPVIVETNGFEDKLFGKELFGPIVLLIKTKSPEHSLALAAEMAEKHGAISCAVYETDAGQKEEIADRMARTGTPVSFNLVGNIYVNQHAGFSDFHVTGGNPSGNASFTDADFINRRFTWVGLREPVTAS